MNAHPFDTLRPLSRKSARRLLAHLDARAKSHPAETMKCRTERNGRGDYGRTEIYSTADGAPAFAISFDGARVDVRFFAAPDFFAP